MLPTGVVHWSRLGYVQAVSGGAEATKIPLKPPEYARVTGSARAAPKLDLISWRAVAEFHYAATDTQHWNIESKLDM